MYCTEEVDRNSLINIVSMFATKDCIKILPFMFTQKNSLRVVCPCCILDKRVDNDNLASLKRCDEWASMFVKEKSKIHALDIRESDNNFIEPGFFTRPVNETAWRSKYGKIDTPVFRDLGFRGYKFDRNIFFPLAVHKINKNIIRIGIPNPSLLNNQPTIQHAAASWVFRLRDVPPYDFPDILPISNVGSLQVSDPISCRSIYSCDKPFQIGTFYEVLFERANRKGYLAKVASSSLQTAEI